MELMKKISMSFSMVSAFYSNYFCQRYTQLMKIGLLWKNTVSELEHSTKLTYSTRTLQSMKQPLHKNDRLSFQLDL